MEAQARLTFDQGTLVLSGDGPGLVDHLPPGVWAWDSRVRAWRCDAIHYREAKKIFRQVLGPALDDQAPAWAPVRWRASCLHPPRPAQEKALDAWRGPGEGPGSWK